nr:PREDICTED: ferritin heavy chain-like [Rhinolophus sinicus]
MILPLRCVRQNYHPHCEAAINYQINLELYASSLYLSMASYFDSHEVALKHFSQFFLRKSSKEREHAFRLMWLQNQRGGLRNQRDIRRPYLSHWNSSLGVMKCALHVAISVNQSLLDLHQLATEKMDAHLYAFLDRHYLCEQVKSIRDLRDLIASLRNKLGALEASMA